MTETRDPNEGVVHLPTPSLTYKLRPTPQAAFDVCSSLGGYKPALRRVIEDADLVAMYQVALAGTQVKGKAAEDLRQAMFTAGLGDVTEPIVRFLTILMAGGRRPEDVQDNGDEGNA